MKRLCKVQIALGKYKGSSCNSLQDAEYTFEVEWNPSDTSIYNDGNYTLTTFHNGEQADLEFNGWSFAGVNQGGYHYPGSYSSVNINIECCDPEGVNFNLRNSVLDTENFLIEGAPLYMNRIMLVSLFKDKNEYESVADLFGGYWRSKDSNDHLKDTLNKLQRFKEVIKRNEFNEEIPNHFITNAKREYKQIVNFLKENVELNTILDVLFD